jgi:hypothetical protein
MTGSGYGGTSLSRSSDDYRELYEVPDEYLKAALSNLLDNNEHIDRGFSKLFGDEIYEKKLRSAIKSYGGGVYEAGLKPAFDMGYGIYQPQLGRGFFWDKPVWRLYNGLRAVGWQLLLPLFVSGLWVIALRVRKEPLPETIHWIYFGVATVGIFLLIGYLYHATWVTSRYRMFLAPIVCAFAAIGLSEFWKTGSSFTRKILEGSFYLSSLLIGIYVVRHPDTFAIAWLTIIPSYAVYAFVVFYLLRGGRRGRLKHRLRNNPD